MKKILATVLSSTLFVNAAHAAETVVEKVKSETNDVKRAVKKTAHRVDEKICEATDKSCLAKKVNNRATEVKDYAKDKTSEASNVIDNDTKVIKKP